MNVEWYIYRATRRVNQKAKGSRSLKGVDGLGYPYHLLALLNLLT